MMSGQQALDALKKKQLCPVKEANPKLTYEDLIAKAKQEFKKDPSESQITRISRERGRFSASA
jgi:hypothetical protein